MRRAERAWEAEKAEREGQRGKLAWNDEPTIVIGIAMKSTPHTMATDVTSLPPGVAGQRSP